MSLRYSYYPGCSLHSTSREYDLSARAVCAAFGVELEELKDWVCCGATSAHALDSEAAHALGVHNLVLAEAQGLDVVTPCAACFNRLKTSEYEAKEGLRPASVPTRQSPYSGKVTARHLLDVFARDVGVERIRQAVKQPLAGLKPVSYYGCLLVRPQNVMKLDDPEDPALLDEMLRAVGAAPVEWSYKTECCGASMSVPFPSAVETIVGQLAGMAREAGANCFVTACPLCQLNLDTRQTGPEPPLPAFFFTELLGLALALPGANGWFAKHLVSPAPVLQSLLAAAQA